jgi:hypothetical protein
MPSGTGLEPGRNAGLFSQRRRPPNLTSSASGPKFRPPLSCQPVVPASSPPCPGSYQRSVAPPSLPLYRRWAHRQPRRSSPGPADKRGKLSLVERAIAIGIGSFKITNVGLRLRLGDGGSATRVDLLPQSVAVALAHGCLGVDGNGHQSGCSSCSGTASQARSAASICRRSSLPPCCTA